MVYLTENKLKLAIRQSVIEGKLTKDANDLISDLSAKVSRSFKYVDIKTHLACHNAGVREITNNWNNVKKDFFKTFTELYKKGAAYEYKRLQGYIFYNGEFIPKSEYRELRINEIIE